MTVSARAILALVTTELRRLERGQPQSGTEECSECRRMDESSHHG